MCVCVCVCVCVQCVVCGESVFVVGMSICVCTCACVCVRMHVHVCIYFAKNYSGKITILHSTLTSMGGDDSGGGNYKSIMRGRNGVHNYGVGLELISSIEALLKKYRKC